MDKIKIVYWSGTGNTEEMAHLISEGIIENGGESMVVEVSSASEADLKDVDVFALGCPSMGDEVLEEDVMEPFVTKVEGFAKGKKIALFGSYGWGNCEWMRDWEARMTKAGAVIVGGEGITVLGEADSETKEACKNLGKEIMALHKK